MDITPINSSIDRNVLVFNRFGNSFLSYILLAFTIILFSYIIPLSYYLYFYGYNSFLFHNFINDTFYISISVVLFPLHAIVIKYLWYLISKLVDLGITNKVDFKLKKSKMKFLKKKYTSGNSNFRFKIFIPIISFFLAILFMKGRESSLWWGNNPYEYFGSILFTISLSFVFYQLICHNVLGIKAVNTLKVFAKLRPQIKFWQVHNDYFFEGFQNIFVFIVFSSLIHVISIISLYYFNYFNRNINILFLSFFIFFLIFGPLFWYYPLYIVHNILNKQKVHILNGLSKSINSSNEDHKLLLISEYEIINSRKTWLISLPIKLFTTFFILLQMTGIIFSIWTINQK
jgi:hypothetical protein